jgi:hypothetical protein
MPAKGHLRLAQAKISDCRPLHDELARRIPEPWMAGSALHPNSNVIDPKTGSFGASEGIAAN